MIPPLPRGLISLCLALCLTLGSPSWAGTVMPASGTMEVAFSPWDDAEGLVLRTLASARHSILVQAYVLTSRNIANALQEAKARGVDVRILADKEQMERNESSLIPQLAGAGIPIRLETRYSAAHNKVLVLDADNAHPVVVTGSYNFSWSAQARNAENLLVLRDNPKLAKAYQDNWLRQWSEAEPLEASVGMDGNASPAPRTARRASRSGDASLCSLLTAQERRLVGSDCRQR